VNSRGTFEARFEHGVELEKDIALPGANGIPLTVFERGDPSQAPCEMNAKSRSSRKTNAAIIREYDWSASLVSGYEQILQVEVHGRGGNMNPMRLNL